MYPFLNIKVFTHYLQYSRHLLTQKLQSIKKKQKEQQAPKNQNNE